jgi:2-polyprenyl-3-methyl-5-hydroxy-6-metoxy-1,4-benzoquinol methylase
LQPPSYYQLVRKDVIEAVQQFGIQAGRVLELGCSAGETARYLKPVVKADFYAGIEKFQDAAVKARANLDAVYHADIEQTSPAGLGLKENDFDLLVGLDVLEHLYNPWDVLADLVKLLKPGGHAVFSIPNVQNINVVVNLAYGKWTYLGEGLLDATHIRFFTLESIHELLTGAGLTVVRMQSKLQPEIKLDSLKDQGNVFKQGKLTFSDLTREEVLRLFTYQYLTIGRRNE